MTTHHVAACACGSVLKGHFGCVNAAVFSHDGTMIASGGDDTRVLLWNTDQLQLGPRSTFTGHASNIFCTAFDCDDTCVLLSRAAACHARCHR